MASGLASLYEAIRGGSFAAIRGCLRDDVFAFGPSAKAVFDDADALATELAGWTELEVTPVAGGHTPSGAAWVFDDLTVRGTAVRMTALVDGAARVAAAYWSVPYGTQAEQDDVKKAGRLEPGVELADSVGPGAQPLVDALLSALGTPAQLPALYSVVDAHATIGSVVDEVFLGAAGQAAWSEFVQFVTAFALRGGVRAALVTDDAGWLSTNIDISTPPTPYRFFYVWAREASGWRIVVSHDAVSRDLP
jgi:hypothetical protein